MLTVFNYFLFFLSMWVLLRFVYIQLLHYLTPASAHFLVSFVSFPLCFLLLFLITHATSGDTGVRELTRGSATPPPKVDPGTFSCQRQGWKTPRGRSGNALLLCV